MKKSQSATASASPVQSAAASAAAATASGPIPLSLPPMTPATANRTSSQTARATDLAMRKPSTVRKRQDDEDTEDETETAPDGAVVIIAEDGDLVLTAAAGGDNGSPNYLRSTNGINVRKLRKAAKQEGRELVTDRENMSSFVHISTAKLIALLQLQRPSGCYCVKKTDLLYINQQASQGSSSRFFVQCSTCKFHYIFSTGDQWLNGPQCKTYRRYVLDIIGIMFNPLSTHEIGYGLTLTNFAESVPALLGRYALRGSLLSPL